MQELPCSRIVYRAMLRKSWIDPVTGLILPIAFYRRPPPKDDDGVEKRLPGEVG